MNTSQADDTTSETEPVNNSKNMRILCRIDDSLYKKVSVSCASEDK